MNRTASFEYISWIWKEQAGFGYNSKFEYFSVTWIKKCLSLDKIYGAWIEQRALSTSAGLGKNKMGLDRIANLSTSAALGLKNA